MKPLSNFRAVHNTSVEYQLTNLYRTVLQYESVEAKCNISIPKWELAIRKVIILKMINKKKKTSRDHSLFFERNRKIYFGSFIQLALYFKTAVKHSYPFFQRCQAYPLFI